MSILGARPSNPCHKSRIVIQVFYANMFFDRDGYPVERTDRLPVRSKVSIEELCAGEGAFGEEFSYTITLSQTSASIRLDDRQGN